MYTVLLADDDKDFINVLSDNVSKELDYKIVATAYDGKSTLEKIETLRPDILILDIIMPESDGIYIVNYIRTRINGYTPVIYLLSGLFSNRILQMLNRLDVDYVSMKPVPFDVIIHNLNTLVDKHEPIHLSTPYQPSAEDTVTDAVKKLSIQLGAMPHHLSSKCMMDALVYNMEHPTSAHPLTKGLYPEIAKQLNLTGSAVERNIRNAIACIQKARTPLFLKIFSYSENKRITNGEFLAVMTEYLHHQMG